MKALVHCDRCGDPVGEVLQHGIVLTDSEVAINAQHDIGDVVAGIFGSQPEVDRRKTADLPALKYQNVLWADEFSPSLLLTSLDQTSMAQWRLRSVPRAELGVVQRGPLYRHFLIDFDSFYHLRPAPIVYRSPCH